MLRNGDIELCSIFYSALRTQHSALFWGACILETANDIPGAPLAPDPAVPPAATSDGKPEQKSGLGAKIQKAGAVVLVAHLCVRFAGLVGKNIIPNYYDLNGNFVVTDVFAVVNGMINFAFLIGEQCLAPSYLPVFAKATTEHGETRAWRYTSILFNLQFLFLLVLVGSIIVFPEFYTGLLTKWNNGDPATASRHALALKMLPYAAPCLIGMSLASLTYVVLNGYKEFFFAAFGDTVLKLSIVGGAALGCVLTQWQAGNADWRYIAGGAVAGGMLKLATHLFALRWKRLRLYQFSIDWKDPYVKAFFVLVAPLLAGVVVSQVRDIIIRREITAGANLATYYDLGQGLIGSIQFLVPYTLSIALLPYFCDLSAKDDNAQLGSVLTTVIRMLVWFFVPVTIAFAAAAHPLSIILFSGKELKSGQLQFVALVTQIYALQLPFAAIEMMVLQAFFSSKRMVAPTLAGFVFSALSATVTYIGVEYKFVSTAEGVLMLAALSLVVARVLKSLLLVAMLRSSVPVLPVAETTTFALRVFIAAGAAAAAAYAATLPFHGDSRYKQIAKAGTIGVAAFGVFIAVSLLLQLEEPRLCLRWTQEKLRRRKK